MGLVGFNPGYFLLRLTTTTFAVASSRFSMPTFLTKGFHILAGIQAGAPLGFFTCFLSPVKICTVLVPRSRSLMSVCPRLAAFKAACLGAFPVKIPISLPSLSRRAKFLISFSANDFPSYIKDRCAITYLIAYICY